MTLSEFYQLLQFVGQGRGVGAGYPSSKQQQRHRQQLSGNSNVAATASCPTRQQTGEMAGKRQRPGGNSLSDLEEANLSLKRQ